MRIEHPPATVPLIWMGMAELRPVLLAVAAAAVDEGAVLLKSMAAY